MIPGLDRLTNEVCRLCETTGNFIREEVSRITGADIQVKGSHNFVTYVDKTSEERLIAGLSRLLPGTGFIAEEDPSLVRQSLTWIIDPLDGTTNFIHGVPLYSISIALMEEDKLILGVVYEVNSKECFYTRESAPAYLNGREIRVSQTQKLNDSLFATGFPYYDYGKLENYLALFRTMMVESRGVRRLGSAAADLAYVACGRFDGFYEYGLSPWDVAAGALLVKNAGGIVTDFSGMENYLFGKELIATNGFVFEEFLGKLKKSFDR